MPLAPAWHTALLVALILSVALTGTLLSRGAAAYPSASGSSIGCAYVPILVVQWSLLVYVCRVGRGVNVLPSLLGRGWRRGGRAVGDCALAIVGWLAIEAITLAWARAFGAARPSSLLPQTALQHFAWVVVALSAGFCEEVVYRGYLQSQLTAFTRSPLGGILLQAALFGAAHADQGLRAVPRVALCGLALGVLARARRSLWPGILCHVGIDVASGFL